MVSMLNGRRIAKDGSVYTNEPLELYFSDGTFELITHEYADDILKALDMQPLEDIVLQWAKKAKDVDGIYNDFHDGVATGLREAIRDIRKYQSRTSRETTENDTPKISE